MSDEKREVLNKITLPSNSHKDREERKDERKDETKKEEKKVEKVTTGVVIQKKKPLGKRFMETFIADDVKNVKNYIINGVLIPAAKDTISDIVKGITDTIKGSIDVALFGETRARSSSVSRDRNKTYVSYNSYSGGSRRDDRRDISQVNRARHEFGDIILSSREEGNEVLSRLVDLIEQYGQASIYDLYDLVGVTGEFTDHKWGWVNLASASVSHVSDGYMLNLPRPVLLD